MPNAMPLDCSPPCQLAQCAHRELANDMKSLQVGVLMPAAAACLVQVQCTLTGLPSLTCPASLTLTS